MVGTNGISGVWRSLKKGIFSKNALFKSYGVTYILQQSQQPYCGFTSTVTSLHELKRLTICLALLETRVNVRGNELLSHSSPSFYTSRIYTPALHCVV